MICRCLRQRSIGMHRPRGGPLQYQRRQKPSLWHLAALILCLIGTSSICWMILSNGAQLPAAGNAADGLQASILPAGKVNDIAIHQTVQQCMLQQDTTIMLVHGGSGKEQVVAYNTESPPRSVRTVAASCPLVHIPLSSTDRSIGLCTDAALYIQLLGAEIVPDTAAALQRASSCGARSAIMFLEPLYEAWVTWLAQHPQITAAYAPNFEHVFGYDREAHLRMQLVLCKVHRCSELMNHYLKDLGSNATLIYTGHTSLDPQAFVPHIQQAGLRRHHHHHRGHRAKAAHHAVHRKASRRAASQHTNNPQTQTALAAATTTTATTTKAAAASLTGAAIAAAQPLAALHVRGKSSLKHTKQLLECWTEHPEWPVLTVMGPMPNEQITLKEARQYMAAANINVPKPGKAAGPGWPVFDPSPAAELAQLLLSHPIHIMPSEREGFGHSINEGRAAGAVLLVPDHPPMNELVRQGSGVLMEPAARFSHVDDPVPVLGKYGNISVSMSPKGICASVSSVLAMAPQELLVMGLKARQLFEHDRAEFEAQMQQVAGTLRQLTAAATRTTQGHMH